MLEFADKVHAILLIFFWGVWLDCSIIIARTFKSKRIKINYQKLHATLMIILTLITITAIWVEAWFGGYEIDSSESVIDIHQVCGYGILAIAGVQIIIGILIALRLRNYLPMEGYPRLKMMHRVCGYSLYTLSRFNMLWGSYFYGGTDWFIFVVIYQLCLIIWTIWYTSTWRKESKNLTNKAEVKKKESERADHVQLIRDIEEGLSRAELIAKYPGVTWIMYGNRVFDITGWVHPGGNYILAEVVGREVSRFLHGAYSLETVETLTHTHSIYALNLLNGFYIGQIQRLGSIIAEDEEILRRKTVRDNISSTSFSTDSKDNLSLTNELLSTSVLAIQPRKWRLMKKVTLAEDIARFDFESDKVKMEMFGTGVTWFGRCFLIGFPDKFQPIRPYTHCSALVPEHQEMREMFIQYFETRIRDLPCDLNFPKGYGQPKNHLSLVIKNYHQPSGFSKQIHDIDVEKNPKTEFLIHGPIGRGLELNTNSHGTFYIICAGTGFLPFVDFLNYMLWKTLTDILRKRKLVGKEIDERLKEIGLDFDYGFKKDFNVRLVGAFGPTNHCLGIDIVKKLAEVSKKFELGTFHAELTNFSDEFIKETMQKDFNADFIRRRIFTDADIYWVCGPPKFNNSVMSNLKMLGVNHEKIILV